MPILSNPPFQSLRNSEGHLVAYVVPVGEYERLRYEMEDLEINQIIMENRIAGKIRPATPEQEAEIVEQMKHAVPLDLEGLIAELENRDPSHGA